MLSVQGLIAVRETEGEPAGESALLRAAQRGDLTALDQLFQGNKHALFTLCYGILGRVEDAEDAVQETFLRALRGLSSFRGQARFRSWLFRIALNICLRWKAARRDTEPLDEGQALSADVSPEAIAMAHLRLMEALGCLPPDHRAILLLKEREGWSAAEIAAAMGWNEKRVYNELFKARRTLVEWRQREADEGERR
jgi:RNA polymerase sigma-70 factor (ECF subfamily)